MQLPLFLYPGSCLLVSFFFTDPATTAIYTLSLHDALPILARMLKARELTHLGHDRHGAGLRDPAQALRSEEHTSELQSPYDLVCRLLLEKKKKKKYSDHNNKKNSSFDCF